MEEVNDTKKFNKDFSTATVPTRQSIGSKRIQQLRAIESKLY